MSLLSRLLGRASKPPETTDWYEAAPRGDVEVYGTQHHAAALLRLLRAGTEPAERDVTLELRREPTNRYDRNAVALYAGSDLVGYMPRELAPSWSRFVEGHNAAGRRVAVSARVWGVRDIRRLYLAVPNDPADYARAAEREAEIAAKREERQRAHEEAAARRNDARLAQDARDAQAARWRSEGLCVDCGAPIERTGRRGRPAIRCATHAAEERERRLGQGPGSP